MKINVRKPVLIIALSALVLFLSAQAPTYALPFTTVYITRPGVLYHRRSCITLRRGGIAISLSNAQSLGYYPCMRCKPPTW
ncbi:MAG: hypothetical protein LBT31_04860 [Synergistaceae bacterium]|jgi:hypothetical protein|nr:hypothetical protein [Synergistaceae bacterium]